MNWTIFLAFLGGVVIGGFGGAIWAGMKSIRASAEMIGDWIDAGSMTLMDRRFEIKEVSQYAQQCDIAGPIDG